MLKRQSLFKKLFSPLAIVGVLSCGLITFVGAYLIHMNVLTSMMEQYEATSSVFADSISQDLIQGIESEVNRKCKALFSNPAVLSVYILREGNDRPVCDLSKGVAASSQEVIKGVSFGDTQNTLAGQISIRFKKQIITSSVFWQYSFALLILSMFVLIAYWFLSKHIIRKVLEPLQTLSDVLGSERFLELKSISSRLRPDASLEAENLYLGVEEQAKKLLRYEDQLVEKTRSDTRAEIASLVAHDIRSPLSGIAAVQADASIGEENQELIRLSLDKIYYLIDQISNKEKLQVKSVESIFDIGSTINKVVRLKSFEFSNSKVELDFSPLKEGSTYSFGHEMELERALSNILNNAFQSIPNAQNGKVSLASRITPNELCVEIKDTGVGIPTHFMSKIGNKGSSLKGNGSGLGIYQAQNAIGQMNGSISFGSVQGQGTTVTIKIPLSFQNSFQGLNLTAKDHFLLVDDDPIVIDNWLMNLSEVPKSNIKVFHSPSKAEKWMKEMSKDGLQRFHAFIDYDMGNNEVTGIEFLNLHKTKFASSHLVTGRWSDTQVYLSAQVHNIKIWPKDWIHHITI